MAKKNGPPVSRIEVTDFQSIAHVDIPLGHFTVFLGESDVGKTALLRAIHATITGKYPSGTCRSGATHSVTTLTVHGNRVSFDGEHYTGDDPDKEITHWEMQDLLGLRVLDLDKDLSVIPQVRAPLAPIFLIADDPAIAAKVLGLLSHSNPLLAAHRESERVLSVLFKARTAHKEEIEHLVTEQETFSSLPERLQQAASLRTEVADLKVLQDELEGLEPALTSFMKAYRRFSEAKKRREAMEAIEIPNVDDLQELWNELHSLEPALAAINTSGDDLAAAEKATAKARKVHTLRSGKLSDAISIGDPCPWSGFGLPEECVTALEPKDNGGPT